MKEAIESCKKCRMRQKWGFF